MKVVFVYTVLILVALSPLGCSMLMSSPTVEKALAAEEKAYNLFCALTPLERTVIRSRENRRFVAICDDEE